MKKLCRRLSFTSATATATASTSTSSFSLTFPRSSQLSIRLTPRLSDTYLANSAPPPPVRAVGAFWQSAKFSFGLAD